MQQEGKHEIYSVERYSYMCTYVKMIGLSSYFHIILYSKYESNSPTKGKTSIFALHPFMLLFRTQRPSAISALSPLLQFYCRFEVDNFDKTGSIGLFIHIAPLICIYFYRFLWYRLILFFHPDNVQRQCHHFCIFLVDICH
jgi:hypothetical protein